MRHCRNGLLHLVILCLLPLTVNADGKKCSERRLVKAVVADYIEGYYMSQPDRLDSALHPTLMKRVPVVLQATGGQFMSSVTKKALIEYATAGYGEMEPGEEFFLRVTKIDIYGNIAMAKAVSPYYVDYVHLVKLEGVWQVINVLWDYRTDP